MIVYNACTGRALGNWNGEFGSTKDKLEDMDVSLKMSASLKGPTLQT